LSENKEKTQRRFLTANMTVRMKSPGKATCLDVQVSCVSSVPRVSEQGNRIWMLQCSQRPAASVEIDTYLPPDMHTVVLSRALSPFRAMRYEVPLLRIQIAMEAPPPPSPTTPGPPKPPNISRAAAVVSLPKPTSATFPTTVPLRRHCSGNAALLARLGIPARRATESSITTTLLRLGIRTRRRDPVCPEH
jgi:hypothetical protein